MISSPFLALPDDIVVDQVRVLHEYMTVVVRSVAPSAPCPVKWFMHTFDDDDDRMRCTGIRNDCESELRYTSFTALRFTALP